MKSGPIFKWTSVNPIADNDKYLEQIHPIMDDVKYEDTLKDNNKELYDHSNDDDN